MNATATLTENDGRNWYSVQFEDGESGTYGMCEDGTMLDADGMPLRSGLSEREHAARRAIERACGLA